MQQIMEGLAHLDLTMELGDRKMVIHPALLWDEDNVVLVDTGFPGMLPAIRAEMEQVGVPFERLTKVVLTHQDYDHIGSLPEILASANQPIEVLAHELDQQYIAGDKALIKWDPSRGTAPKSKVDTLVSDGQVLPFAGGVTVIFSPGHTPGHISLYHLASKTLISGDATVSSDGQLCGPREDVTPDLDLAWKSMDKFTNFDIEMALCYHGGICTNQVNRQLAELVARRG